MLPAKIMVTGAVLAGKLRTSICWPEGNYNLSLASARAPRGSPCSLAFAKEAGAKLKVRAPAKRLSAMRHVVGMCFPSKGPGHSPLGPLTESRFGWDDRHLRSLPLR